MGSYQHIQMSARMDITARIKRSVANRSDDVFLREEFDRFGSQAQLRLGLLLRYTTLFLSHQLWMRISPRMSTGLVCI